MSATSSDAPSGPNGLIETALAGDTSVAGGPLDFSGSSLFFPENPIVSARCASEPIGSPEAAAKEAAALADALCAKISTVSFGDRVFLAPSERDAWRCAIEMVRRYHGIVGRPKRRRFIVCVGASDETESPPLGIEGDDEIIILRTDDHAALQAEIDARTAGILIAPVRTRAGLEVVPGRVARATARDRRRIWAHTRFRRNLLWLRPIRHAVGARMDRGDPGSDDRDLCARRNAAADRARRYPTRGARGYRAPAARRSGRASWLGTF